MQFMHSDKPPRGAWINPCFSNSNIPVFLETPVFSGTAHKTIKAALIHVKLRDRCECDKYLPSRIRTEHELALSTDPIEPCFGWDYYETCYGVNIDSNYATVIEENLHRVMQARTLGMDLHLTSFANSTVNELALISDDLQSVEDFVNRAIDALMIIHPNPNRCIRNLRVTEWDERDIRFYFHSKQWLSWRDRIGASLHPDAIAKRLKTIARLHVIQKSHDHHAGFDRHMDALRKAGWTDDL